MPVTTSTEDGSPAPDRVRTRQDFARALTLLREQAGLTVRQVADKVGAWSTHSTIGDWCAGRSLPSLASRDLFLQVIQACGVSDAELFEQWHQAWLRVRRAPGRPAGNQEPYRGLASFQAEDADWFFGRQALTAELIARLTGLDQVSGGTQLVIGPSGSGKSSLLRAGLIPALRDGLVPGTAPQQIVVLTPGPSPVGAIGEALGVMAGIPAADVVGLLRANSAAEALSRVSEAIPAGKGRPVIIVDQFEEVFAPYVQHDERRLFIETLSAATDKPASVLLVLGLRADCYAEALRCPELVVAAAGQLAVGPMNEAELREAIVGPAHKAKIDIEHGLVELLLREVAPRGYGREGAHDAGVL